MTLQNVISETVRRKYQVNNDAYVNNQKLQYVDYKAPLGLAVDHIHISENRRQVLSPNSMNFLQGVEAVPFVEFRNLASNKRDIDWQQIRRNKHRIDVIGWGGFMSNMFHFITMMAKTDMEESKIVINVYENDEFSTMNGVRTFQDISKIEDQWGKSKLNLVDRYSYGYSINRREKEYYTENTISSNLIIGSPDFDTRIMLEEKNFLFFGNSDSNFVIHKSPVIDPTMTRETYGQINVIEFWVGILEATYEFLYLLEKYDARQIQKLPHNTELWSKNIMDKESVKRLDILGREPEPEPAVEEQATSGRRNYSTTWTTF